MGMSFEELIKSDKDSDLEKQFKNVRTALKLILAKYISDSGSYERVIEGFIGADIDSKRSDPSKKNFLDDLLDIGKHMDDAFNKIGDAAEGALAHRLSSVSDIYLDRISQASYESKLNRFPFHKERFIMDVSEEQEAKSIVPRAAFRSIKMFVDKYYFLFRQCSVNLKAKAVFNKISIFRDSLINFEWAIAHYTNKLNGEYAKEIAPFHKDTKLALLRLRKLCEAIDAASFGSFVKTLRGSAIEMGIRAYVRYNPVVTVASGDVKAGSAISVGAILEKYDRFMLPIRQAAAEYGRTKKTATQRPSTPDQPKMFWDISSQITEFRDGMHEIIDEFSKGINSSCEDFKYFSYAVQNVLIPYMNHSKGEVNTSFLVGVNNLDTFFWKIMVMAIESCQENDENIEEILGLIVRVRKSDAERRAAPDDANIDETFEEE